MQRVILRIELERLAELVDVRITVGQLLAGEFRGAGFAAAGRRQQRRHRAFGIAAGLLHAGQFQQHRLALGQQLERSSVTRGREFKFIALLGQLREFVVGAESRGTR